LSTGEIGFEFRATRKGPQSAHPGEGRFTRPTAAGQT
jgi:hypothetical protein